MILMNDQICNNNDNLYCNFMIHIIPKISNERTLIMDESINKCPTRSWLLKRNYWDRIIRDLEITMKDWTYVINKS